MVLSHIDTEDRFVNGLVDLEKYTTIFNGKFKIVDVKLDDVTVGRNLLHSDVIRRSNNWVAIYTFGLRKN